MREATVEDYRWLYAHGYMPDGLKCADGIMHDIVKRCPGTFLDYGCGRGQLVDLINKGTTGHAIGWDPYTGEQFPAVHPDWIISCDVLEHIPKDQIGATLSDFARIARLGLLLTIANMSDVHEVNGEPVELHLIREPAEWWIDRIKQHWPTCHVEHRKIDCHRFVLIVEFA